jgi:xanthine dehydrogenase molybdenum-binding subunit
VLRLVAVQDVGTAVNPTIVEGQIEGAAHQGLGYALSEDLVVDPDTGAALTGSYMDYRLLGVADGPVIEPIVVEHADPTGPFGAKGAGEPSIILTAPAIANAIYRATGASLTRLPMTPERVLEALRRCR